MGERAHLAAGDMTKSKWETACRITADVMELRRADRIIGPQRRGCGKN